MAVQIDQAMAASRILLQHSQLHHRG